MQSELSRALLGEDMPYATLTYIWCNTRPVGTVLVSPRTDRVRKIVVESGEHHVGQWRDYQRDIARLNPLHLIAVGVGMAFLFVLGLIVLVNWVAG